MDINLPLKDHKKVEDFIGMEFSSCINTSNAFLPLSC